jgi:hypothetical protein
MERPLRRDRTVTGLSVLADYLADAGRDNESRRYRIAAKVVSMMECVRDGPMNGTAKFEADGICAVAKRTKVQTNVRFMLLGDDSFLYNMGVRSHDADEVLAKVYDHVYRVMRYMEKYEEHDNSHPRHYVRKLARVMDKICDLQPV